MRNGGEFLLVGADLFAIVAMPTSADSVLGVGTQPHDITSS